MERTALALQGVALLVNFKRGSWGAALLVLGTYLVIRLKWRGMAIVAAAALAALSLPPVQQRLGEVGEQFDVKGGSRATMWLRVAPGLIRKHPWGVGYAALTNEMMHDQDWRVEPGRDHLHSNVLQVLVETGWAGLVLYLLWMTKAVWDSAAFARAARRGEAVELAGALCLLLMLLAILLNGLVEYNFGDTELMVILAVVMGAAGAGRLRQKRS
jgi:O-antigen ligase